MQGANPFPAATHRGVTLDAFTSQTSPMRLGVVASPHSTGAERETRSAASLEGLHDLLTALLEELDAVAVGIRLREGDVFHNVSLSDSAANLLEEVWRHSASGLMDEVSASSRAIGTNRLRAHSDAPICGKLIATKLKDASGAPIGVLAALRTVDQHKFSTHDSQKLLELATEINDSLLDLLERASTRSAGPSSGTADLMDWTEFEAHIVARESAASTRGCVLYGNIDQLNVLNKLTGFTAGDEAIRATAEALRDENLPEGAARCHFFGDRFLVYVPAATLADARRIAEQLCRSVSERCSRLTGMRTGPTISFGVAAIAADGELGNVFTAAETACRAAKNRGRGHVEVSHDTDFTVVAHNEDVVLVGKLYKALEAGRFGITAQPIYALQRDEPVRCYELLVSLIDERGAVMSPAPFISTATRYQMLAELDRAVISRIFDRLKAARSRLEGAGLRFSINLSGPSVSNSIFLQWLASHIGPRGVPGEWLQFELTELDAMANIAQTQLLIRKLRAYGVEFALDDFGTSVSSCTYLSAFDVSMLKLDASFTRDLLTSRRAESLVREIVQLGRRKRIQTVTEDIETEEVRVRLTELGVDCAQGTLFGQPLSFENVLQDAGKVRRGRKARARTVPWVGPAAEKAP